MNFDQFFPILTGGGVSALLLGVSHYSTLYWAEKTGKRFTEPGTYVLGTGCLIIGQLIALQFQAVPSLAVVGVTAIGGAAVLSLKWLDRRIDGLGRGIRQNAANELKRRYQDETTRAK
jgi:hypothetical protein